MEDKIASGIAGASSWLSDTYSNIKTKVEEKVSNPTSSDAEAPAAGEFFIQQGPERRGPFSLEQVNEMLAGGVIALDSPAWQSGMPEWGIVGRIRGIIPPPRVDAPEPIGPPPFTGATATGSPAAPPVFAPAHVGTAPSAPSQRITSRFPPQIKKYAVIAGGGILLLAIIFIVWPLFGGSLPDAPGTPPTILEIQKLSQSLLTPGEEHQPKGLQGTWAGQSSAEFKENGKTEVTQINATLTFSEDGTFVMQLVFTSPKDTDKGSLGGQYAHSGGRILLSVIPTGDQVKIPDYILNHTDGELSLQGFHKKGQYFHCRGGIFDIIATGSGNDIANAPMSNQIGDTLNEFNLPFQMLLLIRLNFTKQ